MGRKKAREIVMTKLYEMEIHQEFTFDQKIERDIAKEIHDGREVKYASRVIKLFTQNRELIDQLIIKYSEKWDIKRISKVDLSIIRLSIVEMLYEESIPDNISINEAVNLARKFSDEESFKFVNGILGNISRRNQ